MTVAFTWPWWGILLALTALVLLVAFVCADADKGQGGLFNFPGPLGCLAFALVCAVPVVWLGALIGRWLR